MDARRGLVAACAAALVALVALMLVAPERDEVCGPDAFECWPALRLAAQQGALVVGLTLAGALLAGLPSRWAGALGFALVLLAAPVLLLSVLFSSPGSPCQGAPCVPPWAVAALAGALWLAGALLAVRAWMRPRG